VYLIQAYVINFVSDLRQVGGFLRVLRFLPPIKRYSWNIVESGDKHHNPIPLLEEVVPTNILPIHIYLKKSIKLDLQTLNQNLFKVTFITL